MFEFGRRIDLIRPSSEGSVVAESTLCIQNWFGLKSILSQLRQFRGNGGVDEVMKCFQVVNLVILYFFFTGKCRRNCFLGTIFFLQEAIWFFLELLSFSKAKCRIFRPAFLSINQKKKLCFLSNHFFFLQFSPWFAHIKLNTIAGSFSLGANFILYFWETFRKTVRQF